MVGHNERVSGDHLQEMPGFRRAVTIVAALNLAYFGIEATVAAAIGSVSLLADSVDFLEDAAINTLIAFALAWSAQRRMIVGRVAALIIVVPAASALYLAVVKMLDPQVPEPTPLTATALGALVVNLACAAILVRHRHHKGGLATAAWLSARNDALANVAIIAAAGAMVIWRTGWIDIGVGLGIAALNADAAVKVWRRSPKPTPGRGQDRS